MAYTSVVFAAPEPDAQALYKRAVQLDNDGEYDQALAVIEDGLGAAVAELPLLRQFLRLKGTMLLNLRDYPGALAAYQEYLDAGPKGANRTEAQKIVGNLLAVKSTFLEITLANGPATLYLDSRAYGVLCTAAPSCSQAILPGTYRLISERPGFKPDIRSVIVPRDQTTKLAVTLVEKPSPLTVRVAPPGARVTVDGAPHDAPGPVAAGTHRVVASLAGHVEVRREVVAHEGEPIELDIALEPLVPIHVEPPGAALRLDDRPIAIQDGRIEIPPGSHVLVAHTPGFHDRRIEIPAVRGTDYTLVVVLARVERPAVVPPKLGWSLKRKLALVAGGAGAVAASSGVALGLRARQLEGRGYELCPSPTTPCSSAQRATELNERARSRALQANITYWGAGVAAIAAAVLWVTGAPESRSAITPRLGDGAGLDLSVRF